jgi:hypothetical protein
MKYFEFETVLSKPRLGKYLQACGNDKQKALRLYRYNVRLCQKFYGALGILEVALRNAINEHYLRELNDPDWLVTQAGNGFLKKYRGLILKEQAGLVKRGVYTNDRLLSTLTFGVWTYMFSRRCYKNSGKTLLRIFPKKTQGLNASHIYRDLDAVRIFRNRIAHHESLCFSKIGGIDLTEAERIMALIQEYLKYLGYNPKEILYGVELPVPTIEKIKELQSTI